MKRRRKVFKLFLLANRAFVVPETSPPSHRPPRKREGGSEQSSMLKLPIFRLLYFFIENLRKSFQGAFCGAFLTAVANGMGRKTRRYFRLRSGIPITKSIFLVCDPIDRLGEIRQGNPCNNSFFSILWLRYSYAQGGEGGRGGIFLIPVLKWHHQPANKVRRRASSSSSSIISV